MDAEATGAAGAASLTADFTGTQKAAILLIALGPEKSSAILSPTQVGAGRKALSATASSTASSSKKTPAKSI